MAYSDLDQLAINTIRVLAVSPFISLRGPDGLHGYGWSFNPVMTAWRRSLYLMLEGWEEYAAAST